MLQTMNILEQMRQTHEGWRDFRFSRIVFYFIMKQFFFIILQTLFIIDIITDIIYYITDMCVL